MSVIARITQWYQRETRLLWPEKPKRDCKEGGRKGERSNLLALPPPGWKGTKTLGGNVSWHPQRAAGHSAQNGEYQHTWKHTQWKMFAPAWLFWLAWEPWHLHHNGCRTWAFLRCRCLREKKKVNYWSTPSTLPKAPVRMLTHARVPLQLSHQEIEGIPLSLPFEENQEHNVENVFVNT